MALEQETSEKERHLSVLAEILIRDYLRHTDGRHTIGLNNYEPEILESLKIEMQRKFQERGLDVVVETNRKDWGIYSIDVGYFFR